MLRLDPLHNEVDRLRGTSVLLRIILFVDAMVPSREPEISSRTGILVEFHTSSLDEEKNHNVGGVGMAQKGNKNIIKPHTKIKGLDESIQKRRFLCMA